MWVQGVKHDCRYTRVCPVWVSFPHRCRARLSRVSREALLCDSRPELGHSWNAHESFGSVATVIQRWCCSELVVGRHVRRVCVDQIPG